jgi:hypothetical protein
LIAFMVVAHRASLRAIGIPACSVCITVFTAPAISGNEQIAADIASGTG